MTATRSLEKVLNNKRDGEEKGKGSDVNITLKIHEKEGIVSL